MGTPDSKRSAGLTRELQAALTGSDPTNAQRLATVTGILATACLRLAESDDQPPDQENAGDEGPSTHGSSGRLTQASEGSDA